MLFCSLTLLVLAFIISIASIIRFPSMLIKLIVLEVINNLLTAAIALWAIHTQQAVFIDVCLILVLLMFLSTVAYCLYLSKQKLQVQHQS